MLPKHLFLRVKLSENSHPRNDVPQFLFWGNTQQIDNWKKRTEDLI